MDARPPAGPIRTFLVAYGGDYDQADLDRMASDFDLIVWGGDMASCRARAAEVRRRNPESVHLFYRNAQAMHPYYPDWAVVDSHADWFLHDRDVGSRMRHKDWGWLAMDVQSEGWRRHLADQVRQEVDQGGWEGCFLDDAWTRLTSVFERVADGYPAVPSTDYLDLFQSGMRQLVSRLKQSLGEALLIVNGDFYEGHYMGQADGAMMETFVHSSDWHRFQVERSLLESSLKHLQVSERLGKLFLANAGVAASLAPAERERAVRFSFATYLLGSHASSHVSYHLDYTRMPPPFPDFRLPLGMPAEAYGIDFGVYLRRFENGLVAVNPRPGPACVELERPGRPWGADPLEALELEGFSAAVILGDVGTARLHREG